jgi:HSP20 family protein
MRTAPLAHHSVNGNGGSSHMNLETDFNSLRTKTEPFIVSFTKILSDSFPFKTAPNSESYCSPRIDVVDKPDSVQITAECPGMEQSDLDVSWTDGVLAIKGEKKSSWNQESTKLYRLERAYGKFERQISLPVEIEADKVEASYKNGVLTVTLPKSHEAKTQIKNIAIISE